MTLDLQPTWLYVWFGMITVVAIALFVSARNRFIGLSGGYGKGVWSGFYMLEARSDYFRGKVILAIVAVLDALLIYDTLT